MINKENFKKYENLQKMIAQKVFYSLRKEELLTESHKYSEGLYD